MKFEIPSKYHVGGQEINVTFVDHIDNSTAVGDCHVAKGLIRITNLTGGSNQSETSKRNTFLHELVHSILETMGEYELNQNERFVCTFSSLLCESIMSMEN